MIKMHAPRLLICNLKYKLIISKQRVSISVPLQLTEKSTTLSLSNPCLLYSLGHNLKEPHHQFPLLGLCQQLGTPLTHLPVDLRTSTVCRPRHTDVLVIQVPLLASLISSYLAGKKRFLLSKLNTITRLTITSKWSVAMMEIFLPPDKYPALCELKLLGAS